MLASAIRSIFPRAETPGPESDFWYRLAGHTTTSGVDVTADKAMQVGVVFACIRLLSEVIGSLPCILHERVGPDGDKQRADTHPLYTVLHDQPNRWQTAQEFFEMGVVHINLRGNFYCRIVNRLDPVEELIPLNPDWMQVKQTAGNLTYEYNDPRGREVFTAEEIFHVRGLSFNGLTGVSPIEYARNTIGLSLAQQEHGAAVFQNGDVPPFYIKRPEGKRWGDVAKGNFRKGWRGMHCGPKNAHNPPIMEDGMTLEALNVSNRDSQWIEAQGFQAIDLCRFFRIPPHLVAILDRATFSNIEHQGAEFLMYTLGPWLVRFAQAIRRDLIDNQDRYFAEFLTDALLRTDIKTRYEAYSVALGGAPFLTRNEVRQKENFNPMDGADELLDPLNMGDVGGSDNEPAPPGPVAPPASPSQPAKATAPLGPVIEDAARRIAAREISILEARASKAAGDRPKWLAWVEKQTADAHDRYGASALAPLAAAFDPEPTGGVAAIVETIHASLIEHVEKTVDAQWKWDKAERVSELVKLIQEWMYDV